MDAGTSRVIITPPLGLPLAGYFNPRPNTGAWDDLYARCVLFRQGRTVGGIVSLDVCMVDGTFVEAVLARLKEAGFRHGRGLVIAATHTHTAPYVTPLFGTVPAPCYLRKLVEKTVEAVLMAERNLVSVTLRLGVAKSNALAFNRRYWMKGGGVVTNPGKGNPDIITPEGPVDRDIGVLSVERDGRPVAILVNLVNHTDTIGGNRVSADWPGRMERGVQKALGFDPLVLTLIGCSGNINHFDVTSQTDQSSYAEACRIGQAYADRVITLLKRLRPLEVSRIAVANRLVTIPYRTLSDEVCRVARQVLAGAAGKGGGGDLTSEGLASGEGAVARFFAEQALLHRAHCSGKKRVFRAVTLSFGRDFAVTSLPGEPFTEIGLAIKSGSPFRTTWPVTLAMGACGYVPLPACFERGGYETLPVDGGAPREDTAERLVRTTSASLKRIVEKT